MRKEKEGEEETVSTYRIFSRAFCNCIPKEIPRPMPHDGEDIETALNEISKNNADEDILDAVSKEEKLANVDGRYTPDDEGDIIETQSDTRDGSYETRIIKTIQKLKRNSKKYLSMDSPPGEGLSMYSPKFVAIMKNIIENDGLHLIYSQFRTLEGIGIIKLILETNGYVHFKIKKNRSGQWVRDIKSEEDLLKPAFALYTGTEDTEEKEIIRNVYNGTWEYIPSSLRDDIVKQSQSNLMGDIIKILMITASGAEGISLMNCRFVHITEPYWHPVRTEQVIGRARRICSHKELPPELRT